MAQWVKPLLCTHEDQNLDPLNPCLAGMTAACNSSTWEEETVLFGASWVARSAAEGLWAPMRGPASMNKVESS